jgi:hypothetical protein
MLVLLLILTGTYLLYEIRNNRLEGVSQNADYLDLGGSKQEDWKYMLL